MDMRYLPYVMALMLVLMMSPSSSLAQPSALQVPGSDYGDRKSVV